MANHHHHKKVVHHAVKQGDRGGAVKKLQRALGMKHIDGHMGPHATKVLKEFQKRHGMKPDGVCGAETWKALNYRLEIPKGRVLLAPGVHASNPDLMRRLHAVARDIGKDILIKSGSRTQAECDHFWAVYQRGGPIAASPHGCGGHCCSNHFGAPGTGRAADCGTLVNGVYRSIGFDPEARKSMHKHGLVLAVGSEAWHVETTKTGIWRYPLR